MDNATKSSLARFHSPEARTKALFKPCQTTAHLPSDRLFDLISRQATQMRYLLTISAMKTRASVPAELSTPWPEPSGVQVESPALMVRLTPLSS